MFTVGGLVQGLAEVLVHYPRDLPDVVGVEDHVPGQVLSCPLQILLTVALPVTTENISGFRKIFQDQKRLSLCCGFVIPCRGRPSLPILMP